MRRYEKKTVTNVDQEIISLLPTSSKSFSLPNITEQESQHPSRPRSFCCSRDKSSHENKSRYIIIIIIIITIIIIIIGDTR